MMKFKQVHFVGIGGAGMSGIAKVLLEMGYSVSGSDIKESRNTLALRDLGAKIFIGHNSKHVIGSDVVVYSSAISEKNCELLAAKEKKKLVVPRAKMLAWLFKNRRGIAVAGTHGKTTTTSMISLILEKLGLSPTFLVGGELNDIGSNAKFGAGEYLVAEADESDGSLLFLDPEFVVLTNIEADHLEYYKDINEIQKTFSDFVSKIPPEGYLVACIDSPNVQKLIESCGKRLVTYGVINGGDFCAQDIVFEGNGSKFKVFKNGKMLGSASLKIPGVHNISNALAAITLMDLLGLEFSPVASVLSEFVGAKRRFEIMGTFNEITVVDDYAHHPTEVNETLKAARNGKWKRIVCVFQPHRYTRTKFLHKEFAYSFSSADIIVITDVYSACEEPIPGVSGKLIFNEVHNRNSGKEVVYISQKSEVEKFLTEKVKSGDLVLLMGAGDIWTVGENLLEVLRGRKLSGRRFKWQR